MAFERYIDVPIHIVVDEEKKFVLAKDFQLSNAAQINQYRLLGKKVKSKNYTPTGNLTTQVTMNLYVDNTLDTYLFLAKCVQNEDGFSMTVGDSEFNYCYVDSVQFSVSPFTPVILAMQVTCCDVQSEGLIPSTEINSASFDLANGAKSTFKAVDEEGNELPVLEANVSIAGQRQIYYSPGSTIPMRDTLQNCELTVDLKLGGIGKFVQYDVSNTNISVDFTINTLTGERCFGIADILSDPTILNEDGKMEMVVQQQSLSMEEGGFLSGSITLKAILF
jgi:hypothetical protein